MDLIVGTAGHIDHGKTSLVKALTGVDADRLPEEKTRGITIDIGFAELEISDARIGFVDVPGHEKFVKNMLAGASGIDLVMLVVAADEGVMPQTREHFEICRLLHVRSGLVVMTKSDLVDDEMMELARLDVAELVDGSFLENAPVIAVSSVSGVGVSELRGELASAMQAAGLRPDGAVALLPIDRSFTVKGFGPVVTGTLVSGAIRDGDELDLMPDELRVRVRGLQTHGKKVNSVSAGQRVAVNLAGIDHGSIVRGMTLCEPATLAPTQIIDTEIEMLASTGLRSRQRVRVHIGTAEVLARVAVINTAAAVGAGETDFVQLRLESPIITIPGTRFIIRSYSPQATIGGGKVVDALAAKHRRKDIEPAREYLAELATTSHDVDAMIRLFALSAGRNGITIAGLQAKTGRRRADILRAVEANAAAGHVFNAGDQILSVAALNDISTAIVAVLAAFHRSQPLGRGIGLDALAEAACRGLDPSVFRSVLSSMEKKGTVVVDRDVVRLATHRAELSPAEERASERLQTIFKEARADVPRLDDALATVSAETGVPPQKVRTIFQLHLDSGEIAKVSEEFYFYREWLNELTAALRQFADKSNDRLIDVAGFKEIAGISRKYAIPLLEYFDREKITRRAADKRVIL